MKADDEFRFGRGILDDVRALVEKAARENAIIVVAAEAKRIQANHPSSPVPPAKIEEVIIRLAMVRKLTVSFS